MSEHTTTDAGMTVEEWAALPEDEPGELVDGRLEEEEVPDFVHETVISYLIEVLRGWLARRGFVVGSGVKYALGPRRGRMPDVSVFFPGRTPAAYGAVRHAPDIAVEVITDTPRDHRRDRVEKVRDYARFGVRLYWIVDPSARTFEVLRLTADGHYAIALTASEGRIEGIPDCEGLTVDLDALWAEVDRLLKDAPAG